ncbi:MAG: preprotein translocase subunit YajC [Oscillospiraceae bacterium]|nr:preprotein translocase subunit YajC [Oscillospiraceae bacterium]
MELWQLMLVYILGVVVLLYVITILPGKRKNKLTRKMHDSVAVGDKVSTIGGIIGIVTARDDNIVTLLIDHDTGTKMQVVVQAIQNILETHNPDSQAQ